MASPPDPAPRVLRCVAVGLHLDPDRAASAETFVASVAAVLDRQLPADPGVDTLVALPEHTGLLAMLVGERGAEARQRWRAGGSTLEILFALAGSYGEVLGHLARRWPQVRSAGQLLHLACTDTVVRTLVEGLGRLAAERRLWLSVGAALPRWQLVPVAEEAGLASLLAGPEGAGRARVAVPRQPGVRNRQLLLSPTGELAAVHDKVSLVPLEADGEQGLGLEPASLAEVEVADLPIGRVATVISKDAWMPDVNERLDQLGAQLLLQPEAFDRWGVPEVDPSTGQRDLWPPDKFQRGGWWMVQRHPGFHGNIAPMLLGTLGELAFDGQPLIAVPGPDGAPGRGLLGQPPGAGWAEVGPWWRDPAPAEQRAAAASIAAGPPPPAPHDVVAVAQLHLPSRPPPGAPLPPHPAVGASIEVAPGCGALQLVPDLVGEGERAWLAWVATDGDGRQQVLLARGDGHAWERPEALSPAAGAPAEAVAARRWRPRLAVDRDGPICLHLGFPTGNWDLFAVRPGPQAGAVRVDDADTDHGVLRERLHDAPAILADHRGLVAVWSDLRWPWLLPQVRIARSHDSGATWSPSTRVDGGALVGEGDPLAGRSPAESRGQTTPSVALCDGEVVVAWQDRDGDGAPLLRLAWPERPGGREAGTDPWRAPAGQGRPARPVLAAAGRTLWAVWEVWQADGGAALWASVSRDAGQRWVAPRALDPSRPTGAHQRRACVVPVDDDHAVVVLEDDRSGSSSVATISLRVGGPAALIAAAPLRVDDTPPADQARAAVATRLADELLVVWQDTRAGTEQLRSTRLPVGR